MKSSITSMLIALIALTVIPIVYFYGDDFDLMEFLSKPFKKDKDSVDYSPVTSNKKVTVFKWKDENGVWQFGNAPPPGQAGVETMTLRPDTNIMKPVAVPEAEDEKGGPTGLVSLGGKGLSKESLEDPYSPDSVKDLMNNTMDIKNNLENRQQQQEKALQSITGKH